MSELPPRQPPDLRNRGNRPPNNPNNVPGNDPLGQNPGGYPPQPPYPQQPGQPSYPPQQPTGYDPYGQPLPPQNPYGGQPAYPPQNDPYGGQPAYPPQPDPYGGAYPPNPNPYPPNADPLGAPQPPLQSGWNDPLGAPPSPRLGNRPAGTAPLGGANPYADPYGSGLPPAQTGPLSLRRGASATERLRERQLEYLAWGSVVLLLGMTLILMTTPGGFNTWANFLFSGVPLIAGGILLLSGLAQRLFMVGSDVSRITWGVAIMSLALGLTRVLSSFAGNTNLAFLFLSFAGLLVIIAGLVILVQVFRPRHD